MQRYGGRADGRSNEKYRPLHKGPRFKFGEGKERKLQCNFCQLLKQKFANIKNCGFIFALSWYFQCIMKCMLVKAGTLTAEGGVTVLQSIISILEMFPNKYIEKAFTEITKCQEFAGFRIFTMQTCLF